MAIKIKQFTMYRWDGKIKWSHKTRQIVTTNNVMSYATLGEEKEKRCAPIFEAWQYRIWKQSSCMKLDNIGETYAIQLYPIRWFNYNLKWTKWKLHPKSDNYSFWKKGKKKKSTYSAFAPRSCTNSWRGRRNGNVAVSNSPLLLLFELQDPSFPVNLNICRELKYIN